jgi:transmembrane sensor
MSRTDDIAANAPQGGQAAEEAARWFARLQDADSAGEVWLAFERWLSAAPDHMAAYERLEGLWVELDDLAPELGPALAAADSTAGTRRGRPGRPRSTRRRWIAAVAAAAVAASLGGVLLLRPGLQPSLAPGVVYEASSGQIRHVTLADGTRLRLNAGSRLAVRLDGNARRVNMADAEATFDVAHDGRPFLRRVGDSDVRVIGTEFNVRRREGRLVLTVRRGLVDVRSDQAPERPIRLARGDQLTRDDASGRSVVASVDPNEAFEWTRGRVIYRDAPLSEVAADLGRRFGRPIRTADARTGETRFSGVLVLDDQQDVLQRLAGLTPVKVEDAPDGAVILRRRD